MDRQKKMFWEKICIFSKKMGYFFNFLFDFIVKFIILFLLLIITFLSLTFSFKSLYE